MFSKTFFLHCTNVYITRQSHPLFNGQRSTNGNNEPFQWNYQRSIINYCPRGGSMAMLLAIQPPPTTLSRIRLRLKTLLAKIVLRSSGRRQYWIVLVNQHLCSKSASCDLWGWAAHIERLLHVCISYYLVRCCCSSANTTTTHLRASHILLPYLLQTFQLGPATSQRATAIHSLYAKLVPFTSNTIQGIPKNKPFWNFSRKDILGPL